MVHGRRARIPIVGNGAPIRFKSINNLIRGIRIRIELIHGPLLGELCIAAMNGEK